jgi:thiol-disulfide isomerase/thioredoxin
VNPPLRLLLAATALAAAAVGGYAGYRFVQDSPAAATEVGLVRSKAPVDAAADEPPARRVIPERLPDITMSDRDGRLRQLSEWAGRPLLINFWATWCAPCRREIPLLKSLRVERRAQRLEVIGIAIDFRDAVLEYAREIKLDYPLLIGEQEGLEAAAAFGMDMVLPFSVFVDSQGRIVTMKVGELHADEAALILDTVGALDEKRLELPAARARIAAQLKQLAADRARSEP